MTAPLHSEQQKGRKLNEVVGSPVQNMNKIRENSIDYNTIQHNTGPHKGVNLQNHQQYGQNDRIAAYHRRAQTRGMNQMVQPIGDSKSPDKYTINKNLVVNLNDSAVKIGWPSFFNIKGITEEPQNSRMIGRKTRSPRR